MLIDTHCHIHESDFPLDRDEVIDHAHKAGVEKIICVGTNLEDSKSAIDFAVKHGGVFASVGIHPHYAREDIGELERFVELLYPENKLIAIGEIGLDYHYPNDPSPDDQIKVLKQQIELALKHDLPIIFHVRDAYDDFWKVLDSFKGDDRQIRGVLHCFTDTIDNMNEGLRRGFYISLNGISTFTHDKLQKEMFDSIPLDKILLETDAPWLTPYPVRGKVKVNEPAFVREIAKYISKTRDVSFETIANKTTANASDLFKF